LTGFFCFTIFGTEIALSLDLNQYMKKIAILIVLFVLTNSFDQRENAYTTGEWLKMRIHYGVVNAGYATLEVKEATKTIKKYIMSSEKVGRLG
jgi:hypothetical protein